MERKRTVEVLQALADETRLGLVRTLAARDEPQSRCDIVNSCASFLQLSQPAMSHHFGKLEAAGVLRAEKHCTQKTYAVDRALLASMGVDVTRL